MYVYTQGVFPLSLLVFFPKKEAFCHGKMSVTTVIETHALNQETEAVAGTTEVGLAGEGCSFT